MLKHTIIAAFFLTACDLDKDTATPEDTGTTVSDTGTAQDLSSDVLNLCTPGYPTDPLTIDSAALSGDTLTVDVSYSGGCESHVLALCWGGDYDESEPPQVRLDISHDANGDECEAEEGNVMEVDISRLQSGPSPLIVHLSGWGDILYEY